MKCRCTNPKCEHSKHPCGMIAFVTVKIGRNEIPMCLGCSIENEENTTKIDFGEIEC